MYPFSQSVTPAVRSHLDAQVSFLNDVSKSLFRSFQQLVDLNIQLSQTMLEESHITGQKLLTADRHTEAVSVAASRAQPAAEKLRAYQQHISRVAADAQVELARVTEQHVQETSRTARALADEVARVANEETERSIKTQQDTLSRFADPFQQNGGSQRGYGASVQSGQGGSVQGEVHAGGASAQGSVSGAQAAASGSASGRTGASSGKPS